MKYRFETWITADEAVASRFRAYLTEHAGKDYGPPQTLMVRAWLNPDGSPLSLRCMSLFLVDFVAEVGEGRIGNDASP